MVSKIGGAEACASKEKQSVCSSGLDDHNVPHFVGVIRVTKSANGVLEIEHAPERCVLTYLKKTRHKMRKN